LETSHDAVGKLVIPLRKMYGATNRFGFEKLTAKEY